MFNKYGKVFRKYGVTMSNMGLLKSHIDEGKTHLIVTETMYEKTSNGWTPTETIEKEFHVDNYLNVISSIPIFKDRVTYGNTMYGRIPMKLSCISWGTGNLKAVREFKFI